MRFREAFVVLALAAAACGTPETPSGGDMPTGPLLALPTCTPPPRESDRAPAGIVLPDGALVHEVIEQGPVTQVHAYVPLTPLQVRLDYEERDNLQLLQSEDEVFEAELLVSNGTHRTYVKAAAICSQGSQLIAVVAAEVNASGLPVPAGSPTPGTALPRPAGTGAAPTVPSG